MPDWPPPKPENFLEELTVKNPSFETDAFGKNMGYASANGGAIDGWQSKGGVGISPWWSAPKQRKGPRHSFTDNGKIPHGRQAVFMQNKATLSQRIEGFRKGDKYVVTFHENGRHNNAPKRNPRLKVTLGGETIVSEHAVAPVEAIDQRTLPYRYVESAVFVAPEDGAQELVFETTNADRVAVLIDRVRVYRVE